LRQEVQAPTKAIAAFLDIVIEDARRLKLDHLLSDLDRMRGASMRLNAFIDSLTHGISSTGRPPEFDRQLRHDLRTPLNAIKGYSELWIEDMKEEIPHELWTDLAKVKDCADQLLCQFDMIFALAQEPQAPLVNNDGRARQIGMVADVLGSVPPLDLADPAYERVPSSRILVVDDNAANRDILVRQLLRRGHTVVSAADGPGALDLVGRDEFDLVLLDLILPEMGGFEVLRRLKGADHTKDIPVIMISALDELDSVVRCIEGGAEDYLVKPFNPVLLRARIDASLEKKHLRDREKKFIEDIDQERKRSEALLLNILPQEVIRRLRGGEMVIADRIDEATILFCDLVGFTALSQELPAGRTVDLLNRLFSVFDRLVAEQAVEKIKTIGDSYMVAAGIPERQSDHALRIATLAPRMLATVDEIAKATNLRLQARIGIHTGPVVAGVLGTHKFVYDVWGDTVNIASRMESHSLPQQIHISAATRTALSDHFAVQPRGKLRIRGWGIMETYFLTN
jgi:class 3 adenylate cyclase